MDEWTVCHGVHSLHDMSAYCSLKINSQPHGPCNESYLSEGLSLFRCREKPLSQNSHLKGQLWAEGAPLTPRFFTRHVQMEVVETAVSNIRRISCFMHKHLRACVCVCSHLNSRLFPVSLLHRGNKKGCWDIILSSPLFQLGLLASR